MAKIEYETVFVSIVHSMNSKQIFVLTMFTLLFCLMHIRFNLFEVKAPSSLRIPIRTNIL